MIPPGGGDGVRPGTLSNFAGTWLQTDQTNPLMRLRITQNGTQLTVWLSYTDNFGQPFGQARIKGRYGTWSEAQRCAPQFRKPGYNYDNPGMNFFTLELQGSVLTYTQVTDWTSPCDGHPVGTEQIVKHLQRTGG